MDDFENDISPTRIGLFAIGNNSRRVVESLVNHWGCNIHNPDDNCAVSIVITETESDTKINIDPLYLKLFFSINPAVDRKYSNNFSENRIICLNSEPYNNEELVTSVVDHIIRAIVTPDILGFDFGDFYKFFYNSRCYATAGKVNKNGSLVHEITSCYTDIVNKQDIQNSLTLVLFIRVRQGFIVDDYEQIIESLNKTSNKPRYVYSWLNDDLMDSDNVEFCFLIIPWKQ